MTGRSPERTTKFIIRRLNPNDTDAYAALLRRGLEEHAEFFRIAPDDVAGTPPPFALEGPDDFTLAVCIEENRLAGIVSFARDRRVRMRHKGLLFRMFVAQEAAGQGMGRALLRAALDRARAIPGLEQVNLTVIAGNARAKTLYVSEGFQTFALERRAVKTETGYLDEERMALRL